MLEGNLKYVRSASAVPATAHTKRPAAESVAVAVAPSMTPRAQRRLLSTHSVRGGCGVEVAAASVRGGCADAGPCGLRAPSEPEALP